MWEDDELDLLLSSAMGRLEHSLRWKQTNQPLSSLQVGEKFVTVVFDLPGVERDEVVITCTDDRVSVEAEVTRRAKRGSRVTEGYARYSKQVVLPVKVVSEKGTAKFKNGMITVKLPRRVHRPLKEPGKRLRLTA